MKRVKKKGAKKLNNKGMTLVEIMIAMLMLSLVSVVVLESMSLALKLNIRAQEKQHALSFGQTLMEGMKAYDRDTIDAEFGAGVAKDSFRLLRLNESANAEKSVAVSGADRVYTLKKVNYNGETYDAKITTKPVTSSEQVVVTIEDMNAYNDGIFRQRKDENDLLLADVQTFLTSQGDAYSNGTSGNFYKNINVNCVKVTSRLVEVNIAANDVVTVKVTYTYDVSNHPLEDALGVVLTEELTPGVPTEKKASVTGRQFSINYPEPSPGADTESQMAANAIYNSHGSSSGGTNPPSSSKGAKLEKLYMFYFPAYEGPSGGTINSMFPSCASDTIKIVNASNNLKDVHILKQRNEQLNLSAAQLGERENAYKAHVDVTSAHDLEIYHNFNISVSGTAGTTAPVMSGDLVNKGEPWADDAVATPLVYSVEIEVVKTGDTEVLSKLVGTTNAK